MRYITRSKALSPSSIWQNGESALCQLSPNHPTSAKNRLQMQVEQQKRHWPFFEYWSSKRLACLWTRLLTFELRIIIVSSLRLLKESKDHTPSRFTRNRSRNSINAGSRSRVSCNKPTRTLVSAVAERVIPRDNIEDNDDEEIKDEALFISFRVRLPARCCSISLSFVWIMSSFVCFCCCINALLIDSSSAW